MTVFDLVSHCSSNMYIYLEYAFNSLDNKVITEMLALGKMRDLYDRFSKDLVDIKDSEVWLIDKDHYSIHVLVWKENVYRRD